MVEHMTLDPWVVSSSPTLGDRVYLIKKKLGTKGAHLRGTNPRCKHGVLVSSPEEETSHALQCLTHLSDN